MIDYNEMRKKFRPKNGALGGSAKKNKTTGKAAALAIKREYEMKKADLEASAPPLLRKGPLFYGIAILLLAVAGVMVLSAAKNGVGFGKKRIELKPLQARQSMRALAVALGRYKFHVGEYPSTSEGLNAIAS